MRRRSNYHNAKNSRSNPELVLEILRVMRPGRKYWNDVIISIFCGIWGKNVRSHDQMCDIWVNLRRNSWLWFVRLCILFFLLFVIHRGPPLRSGRMKAYGRDFFIGRLRRNRHAWSILSDFLWITSGTVLALRASTVPEVIRRKSERGKKNAIPDWFCFFRFFLWPAAS